MGKGRMTAEEAAYYLRQVERRGKARSLPKEELAKWRRDYDRITDYLRREYRRFLCSQIIRRSRYIDRTVLQRFAAEEGAGLFALANQALNEGNADDFSVCCWWLHLRYMVMWETVKEEKDGRW